MEILLGKRAARVVVAFYAIVAAAGVLLYLIFPIIIDGVCPVVSSLVACYMMFWFSYDWKFERQKK